MHLTGDAYEVLVLLEEGEAPRRAISGNGTGSYRNRRAEQ